MVVYNFKKMHAVPTALEMVDIVLMRTQRKTPTVIHPGYKITRIRSFYIRKIKFTQQTIHERLSTILSEFPRLNDVHPFYADLCNTLYDRDHYKLALGQLNTARSLVDGISRDMIRMVKYGDSLYRCKCLKRAALGRMCTILKRQKSSLGYLEQVRKHMSRLPALDPHTRTLLLCGLPNVGKSSFMNKITRADVDVQPYAFTTKSLFVGHCDYRYLRWQVIDTPGILDHSLEERNTIEMQAITALAHLTCSVLYFCDISEQCGYSIEQQCALFRSIQPLFANKQLVLVINKVDQQPWATLEESKKSMIESLIKEVPNCTMIEMSNTSELNIAKVKNTACDKLLASRVDARVASNKISTDLMNRLQVFTPVPRDNVDRVISVPDSVKQRQEAENSMTVDIDEDEEAMLGAKKIKSFRTSKLGYAPAVSDDDHDEFMDGKKFKTARDYMCENGGAGVWAPDYREQYDLKDDEWRFDAIPEILNGRNIADYIDPDIDIKLKKLEQEEDQLAEEAAAANMLDDESDLEPEEEAAVTAIRERKTIIKKEAHVNNTQNKPVRSREIRNRPLNLVHNEGTSSSNAIKTRMDKLGVDTSKMLERGRQKQQDERGRKRTRSLAHRKKADDVDMEEVAAPKRSMSKGATKKQKMLDEQLAKDEKRSRSHSRPRKPSDMGVKDEETMRKVQAEHRKEGQKWSRRHGTGEGDQRQTVHLVKWMNTGKKRLGTSYCR